MCARLVRDLMTLSLKDEGHRNCSGHRGWCYISRFSVNRL